MHKQLLMGVTVLSLAATAMLPGVAGGAPNPAYTLTCVTGGDTNANWSRAKLVQVTFEWTAPAGSSVTFAPAVVPTVGPKPPRGFIVASTPSSASVSPASLTASFERLDGSVDQVTVSCS